MELAVTVCLPRDSTVSGGFIIEFCNTILLVCVEQAKAKEINCLFGVYDALIFSVEIYPSILSLRPESSVSYESLFV